MKRLATLVVVLAALLVTSVAFAAGTLTGRYQTKIATGVYKGKWVLKASAHSVAISWRGKLIGHSTLAYKGHAITVGPGAGCSGSGTYTFKVTGKKVKFTLVKDTCPARVTVLSHTYTKVG